MESLTPIPSPRGHYLRPFRRHWLPWIGFLLACFGVAAAWKLLLRPTSMVGQVEALHAVVSCRDAGLLTNLWARPFQEVKAGTIVAEVITTDPRTVNNRLEVLRDRMRLTQLEMTPLLMRQRSALDYEQLKVNAARVKAELGMAKANLVRAQADLRRKEELGRQSIISEAELDLYRAIKSSLEAEVNEKNKLVEESDKSLERLSFMADSFVPGGENDPLKQAITVEEDKVRVFEERMRPLPLIAPIDGFITQINHQAGEQLTAGQPVLTITSAKAERILGFLAHGYSEPLKLGMAVEVSTRRRFRSKARAQVIGLNPHYGTMTNSLVMPLVDRHVLLMPVGRVIAVSVPPELGLLPGEPVDLRLLP